jgi:phosphoglycerate kinase
MNKKTIRDLSLKGKRVLMRVDFNVPIENGKVGDDTRITAALPSIRHVLDHGASLVLMSHLGRPKGGKPEPEFSLKPVVARLQELLGKPVAFAPDCIGPETENMAKALTPGQVLLLENVRFHKEEEGKVKLADDVPDAEKKAAKAEMKEKQAAFAKKLAGLGDVFVNDAFGAAHRSHASTAVITKFVPESAAGFLMEKEITHLGQALTAPKRPFVAIIGGAKISGKIDVLINLLDKVDAVLVGGGMVYTFYKAMGLPVGKSLVEEDRVELARETLAKVKARGVRFLLPTDHLIADAFSADAACRTVGERDIPDGWMALDIGPATIQTFSEVIASAKTIVWNGPMGCFEMAPFAEGTMAVARAMANNSGAITIVGGGDSVSAVNRSGMSERFTHISTGGGASLEFLEGKELPGVTSLTNK